MASLRFAWAVCFIFTFFGGKNRTAVATTGAPSWRCPQSSLFLFFKIQLSTGGIGATLLLYYYYYWRAPMEIDGARPALVQMLLRGWNCPDFRIFPSLVYEMRKCCGLRKVADT